MKLNLTFGLIVVATVQIAHAQQFTISTVAGYYSPGNTVTGAIDVPIGNPAGLAMDAAGNIYFSSSLPSYMGAPQSIVLRIDPNGILSRVAGNPVAGFSGDGGAAGSAMLHSPSGVAVDKSGNLYIADTDNNRVRKVSPAGIITTVAGNGTAGYSGDGGPATGAMLNGPGPLAIDSKGNLYIGESNSSRIRQLSSAGIITTFAGNGTPGFAGDGGPATSAELGIVAGLTVDSSDNLYFSDNFYTTVGTGCDSYELAVIHIRKISPQGVLSTVAGNGVSGYSGDGGPATSAELLRPGALAADNKGNLYIADFSNIRKVSGAGIITTFAGNGTNYAPVDGVLAINEPSLFDITGLALDTAGNLYLAQPGESDILTTGSRIRKISEGIIFTVAGQPFPVGNLTGDGGPATLAPLDAPVGVGVKGSGLIFIADSADRAYRMVPPQGTIATAGFPSEWWPGGLLVDGSDNLFIIDSGYGQIFKIMPDLTTTTVVAGEGPIHGIPFSGDGGPAVSAQLYWPRDLAFDSSGNMYIADTANYRIRMVNAAGIINTIAGNGKPGYSGDGGPAASAVLNLPSGLAVDTSGNLYISDTNNFRVRMISTTGVITTVAGIGTAGYSGDGGMAVQAQLSNPTGLKFDGAGNLYIADGGSVRRMSPNGIITTVAGNGVIGYSGDGGLATDAQLGAWGLAFDNSGNLYVADPWSNTIRVLKPN